MFQILGQNIKGHWSGQSCYHFFIILKPYNQIPKLLELRRTTAKVTSADASSIRVEVILKYPLSFSDHAKSITLTFNSFIVIRGLANSMKIGKPVLDAIGAT